VVGQYAIGTRTVWHFGVELVVRHLSDHSYRRVDVAIHPLDKLGRRQDWTSLFVELQEVDDLRDVLRENELVAA